MLDFLDTLVRECHNPSLAIGLLSEQIANSGPHFHGSGASALLCGNLKGRQEQEHVRLKSLTFPLIPIILKKGIREGTNSIVGYKRERQNIELSKEEQR
jgi:hypothetical protein